MVDFAQQELSESPPPFFSQEFYDACSHMAMSEFGVRISEDLSDPFRTEIYKFLVAHII